MGKGNESRDGRFTIGDKETKGSYLGSGQTIGKIHGVLAICSEQIG